MIRNGFVGILSVVVTIGLSACGDPDDKPDGEQPASGRATNGTIVAVLQPFPEVTAEAHIVVIEPGGLRTIAKSDGSDGVLPSVAVSADGRRVAYDDAGRGIHTVGIDGKNNETLSDTGGTTSVSWSPDGKRLAYDTSNGYKDSNHGAILVRNLKSDTTTRLTPIGEERDQAPRFLPDGRIVFQHYGGSKTNFDIWVMNGDGTKRRQLTRGPGFEILPVPSPDGKLIAFSGFSEDKPGSAVYPIQLIDLEGTTVRKLAGTDFADAWSPDGEHLLVDSTASLPQAQRATTEDYGLWLRPVAGGRGRVLLDIPGPGTVQAASWSAGG